MGYTALCSVSRLPLAPDKKVVFFDNLTITDFGPDVDEPSVKNYPHNAMRGTYEDGMFLPDGWQNDNDIKETRYGFVVREDIYDAYLSLSKQTPEDISGLYHFLRNSFVAILNDLYSKVPGPVQNLYIGMGYSPDLSPEMAYEFSDKHHLKSSIKSELNRFYYESGSTEPSRDTWRGFQMFSDDPARRQDDILRNVFSLSEEDFISSSQNLLDEMAFIRICKISGTPIMPALSVSDFNLDIALSLRQIEQVALAKNLSLEKQKTRPHEPLT